MFLIVVLGSIALPLTSGFVGEFLLLVGVYNYNVAIAAVAGVSVILGAVYMLRSYQAVMLGETTVVTAHFAEITKQEKFVLVPLVLLIIGLGVYPHPLLGLSETALQSLINGMHLTVLP